MAHLVTFFNRAFSLYDHSKYCLAYLATGRDFGDTLGVAYVGGICANHAPIIDKKTKIRERRSTNVGFVSVADPIDGLAEAEHTLAHEIGHSLGASHDLSRKCGGRVEKGSFIN